MTELKVGQFWQGRNIGNRSWDSNTVVFEVVEIIKDNHRPNVCLLYKYNSNDSYLTGLTTQFYNDFITLSNYRLVRMCRFCNQCFPKDSNAPQDGYMTCWKCELFV